LLRGPKAIAKNGNGRGGVEKAVPRSKMPFGSAATKPTAHFASGLVGLYYTIKGGKIKETEAKRHKSHTKCGLRVSLLEKSGSKNRYTFELILKKFNSLFYVPTVDSVAFKTVRNADHHHHHHHHKIKINRNKSK
jgi:hypothetical protein